MISSMRARRRYFTVGSQTLRAPGRQIIRCASLTSGGKSPRKFLPLRLHMVPRLRTIREDVHRRNEPRGIGKAASLKPDDVRHALQLHRNLASAIWAKTALDRFSAVANAAVVTKLAVQRTGTAGLSPRSSTQTGLLNGRPLRPALQERRIRIRHRARSG